jgi:DnaK suppressor protein
MTTTELMTLKSALEGKQLELAAQLRGRIKDLTIEAGQPDPLDWVQSMSDRDAAAAMVSRASATLADVIRSLRAIDEDSYGNCIRCERPIAVKRLQSIPWAAYCVHCQEHIEANPDQELEPRFDQPRAA